MLKPPQRIASWPVQTIEKSSRGFGAPPGDVAVLNALGLARGARGEREADDRSQAWRPWRAYAVLKLWNSLEPTP